MPLGQQQYIGLNNPQQDTTQIQQQQEKDFIQRWCGTGSLPIFQPPKPSIDDLRDQIFQLPQDVYGYQGFGEQMTGFGETLGGGMEKIGGLGEKIGGLGEKIGGFGEQFSNIDNKLQGIEQGITGLTDKMGIQQQPQNPFEGLSSMFFGGGYGGNPFYSGYSYF